MADAATTTIAVEPDGAPRLANLDTLRGIAILGILFMNINAMGGALLMAWMDVWRYGHSGADEVAFFLRNTLADGTARCLLEMLFGVGMVILTERAAAGAEAAAVGAGRGARALRWLFGPWAVMRAYYWRNFVLFLFGVVHVFVLLWPGDILHTYGIAAMIAFLFRRLGTKTLLAIGLSMAIFTGVTGWTDYYKARVEIAQVETIKAAHAAGRPVAAQDRKLVAEADARAAKRAERRAAFAARMTTEDAARGPATGSFATWVASLWDVFLWFQAKGLELESIWEAAATMLIGAALFRWGVIQGHRSTRFYLILMIVGYAIGLPPRGIAALDEMTGVRGPNFLWGAYEFARLGTTLGHVALIHLLLRTAAGAWALRPFVAVGRTALSVYILQSFVCLWLLYPPFALGLYGTQGWAAWMGTAVAVNLALTVLANWYVRHYRIAPVEWAWRSIVAGQRLPIRKRPPLVAGGVPVVA